MSGKVNTTLKVISGVVLLSNGSSTSFGASKDDGSVAAFLTWFTLSIMILSLFNNGVCLTAFFLEKRLRTVSNYNLINLTISDFLYAAISMPCYIIYTYNGYWPYGRDLCTFYLWVDWTMAAAAQNAVLLIGFDRVWALYLPYSYHQRRKTKTVALAMTIGMWIWIQICILPGMIGDRIQNSSTNSTADCRIEMETPLLRSWASMVNFVNYIIPQALIIVSFLMVAWKLRQHSRGKVAPGNHSVRNHKPSTGSGRSNGQMDDGIEFNPEIHRQSDEKRFNKERRIFRLFAYLTVSMLICWVPGNVYYTMYNIDPDTFDLPTQMAVNMMMYLNTVTNPFLYHVANEEIRRTVFWMLRFSRSRQVSMEADPRSPVRPHPQATSKSIQKRTPSTVPVN